MVYASAAPCDARGCARSVHTSVVLPYLYHLLVGCRAQIDNRQMGCVYNIMSITTHPELEM